MVQIAKLTQINHEVLNDAILCGATLIVARRGGLIGSMLDYGSSPGWYCILFFGKALQSPSASLLPSVQMGTGEFSAGRGKYSLSPHATETEIR